jgi:hypothetical protein
MTDQTVQDCTGACLDCTTACETCIDCCIGDAALAGCLRLCLDCAEIVRLVRARCRATRR